MCDCNGGPIKFRRELVKAATAAALDWLGSRRLLLGGCDPRDPIPLQGDPTETVVLCAENAYLNYLVCLAGCPASQPECCDACFTIYEAAHNNCVAGS